MKAKLHREHWQALGLEEETPEAQIKTETSKDEERKKVTVGLGDATAQEMATTSSGADKPTHEASGQGEEAMTVDATAAPVTPPPDVIKVEKIGDEMFMRDDAGNLILLGQV